jgi:hypothetical protein
MSFWQLCLDAFRNCSGELPIPGFQPTDLEVQRALAPWMMNQKRRLASELPIFVSFQLYSKQEEGFSFV